MRANSCSHASTIYIVCQAKRVVEVHRILWHQLWEHARISLHAGRRKCGTRSGVEPEDCYFQEAAELATPTAVVWRGDRWLPTSQQRFKVLGILFGLPDLLRSFLRGKIASHQALLDRIPAAWLLLSYCAAARANFFLKSPGVANSIVSFLAKKTRIVPPCNRC